ncbi:uncharacterized, partial [Tachysurus ichikawai]
EEEEEEEEERLRAHISHLLKTQRLKQVITHLHRVPLAA